MKFTKFLKKYDIKLKKKISKVTNKKKVECTFYS